MPELDYNAAIVQNIVLLLMVTIRCMAMFATSSIFMLPGIPQRVRYWVCIGLALIVVPNVNFSVPLAAMSTVASIILMSLREFLIGASLGLIASMPLYAMQMSGFFDGTFIGLNMMNMFDPTTSEQQSVLAQMKFFLAIWFFLHWNGHLLLVQALTESFRLVPPGFGEWLGTGEIPWMEWLQDMFVLAFRISLPIFGCLLLAQIAFGFIAKTMPQMNLFVLGIPIKIAMGFVVLAILLPTSVDLFHQEIEGAVEWALSGIHYWR